MSRESDRSVLRFAGGELAMSGWIGLFVSAVAGGLFVGIGAPLAQRRIPRNWFYGVRTRTTMRSDAIWYPVNERGGRQFVVLGGALLFLALISLVFLGNDDTQKDFAILAAVITLAGIAWSVWSCLAYARQLDRQLKSTE
jgi:hypothetical protein